MDGESLRIFREMQAKIDTALETTQPTVPKPESVQRAARCLHDHLPEIGESLLTTSQHLRMDIWPGLNGGSLSSTYYGFVTGGVTPAARLAESVVSLYDQNLHVHLPQESIATGIEDRALYMLLELFDLEPQQWPARVFTTGATASNLLGLACGREHIVSEKLLRANLEQKPGEGILSSCRRAGIDTFQILTTLPHSSLGKAANIVGIGSDAMIDVSRNDHFLVFDLKRLEKHLAVPNAASIVVISCGEVNTGAFATNSIDEVLAIRSLCERYGAWLHVDAAFGIFARVLPTTSQYSTIREGTAGLELADSIGGDGHKMLNVPYDCGFFFCRAADVQTRVFQNTNAAYLSSSSSDGIISPLNLRIENSSRFRGLPVYATLITYGRSGYAEMTSRMVDLARKIAVFIQDECPHLMLLPEGKHSDGMETVYMCVLFRAKDDALNEILVEKIKATRRVYASSTKWEDKPAARFAIAKWDVSVERDFKMVADVLKRLN